MGTALLLHHAIEGMATWLRVERNLAPRTRAAYVADLERFDAWVRETLEEADGIAIDRIGPEIVQDYLRHLRAERACKPPTINRAAASLRVLFTWCVQEGHLAENPTEDLARPKLPRRLPVYLTRDEVDRLFAAPDQTTPAGRRDHAILITLAYTGVRLSELVGMNTIDIDFPRAQIRVFGKGRKERLVPLNDRVVAALRAMLEDSERNPAPGEKAVFLNLKGRRLTGRAVEDIVKACALKAGLPQRNISPHKLRHTFATLLHGKNVDLIDIQALMGHASLASTQIYTHTNAGRLRGAVERLPDLAKPAE
jgi:site-specific recombinase XerD